MMIQSVGEEAERRQRRDPTQGRSQDLVSGGGGGCRYKSKSRKDPPYDLVRGLEKFGSGRPAPFPIGFALDSTMPEKRGPQTLGQ